MKSDAPNARQRGLVVYIGASKADVRPRVVGACGNSPDVAYRAQHGGRFARVARHAQLHHFHLDLVLGLGRHRPTLAAIQRRLGCVVDEGYPEAQDPGLGEGKEGVHELQTRQLFAAQAARCKTTTKSG
jgi:hypothetical protein